MILLFHQLLKRKILSAHLEGFLHYFMAKYQILLNFLEELRIFVQFLGTQKIFVGLTSTHGKATGLPSIIPEISIQRIEVKRLAKSRKSLWKILQRSLRS